MHRMAKNAKLNTLSIRKMKSERPLQALWAYGKYFPSEGRYFPDHGWVKKKFQIILHPNTFLNTRMGEKKISNNITP